MKKNIFIITLLVGCCSLSVWAQKQEKTITVEVNNNWDRAKTDEPVVINLRDLHTGFKVKSAVVMEGSSEIPSQLDDLNRDRKMDELAFVTSLPAHGRKTFQVTLSSEKSTKTYPARVYAEMFIADPRKGKHQSVQAITVPGTSNIYSMVRPHGPVLESELVGYRLYFNEKQTPDIYGKFNKGLEIKESQFYPTDEFEALMNKEGFSYFQQSSMNMLSDVFFYYNHAKKRMAGVYLDRNERVNFHLFVHDETTSANTLPLLKWNETLQGQNTESCFSNSGLSTN
jgi:hypothetical protein